EWRHMVVDEFQDANTAQIELLRLLMPPRQGTDGPDLCVVGDDDQSIYEFRGADDRAFKRFIASWEKHATVRLGDNYRSTPPSGLYLAVRLRLRPPISMDLTSVQALQGAYRSQLSRFKAGEPGGTDPGGFVDWAAARAADDPCIFKLAAWHGELRTLAADASA